MTDIPVLLLAAGSSSRMGTPKQLLKWGNHTLIEHQIQTLLKTGNHVCVVLGANSNLILPLIEKFEIKTYINNDWEFGLGSSISLGIKKICTDFPNAEGLLIVFT